MNLVSFSIRTKGIHNFTRRLWTVFARFGVSEGPTRNALYSIIGSLRPYGTGPTFFIPAVVLNRHRKLIAEIEKNGSEIGVHGYVHNDYRSLNEAEQFKQTERAISLFQSIPIHHKGFRNPYLGWTEESLRIFSELGFLYESNEAIIHDVIDVDNLTPLIRSGFEKSLDLFQAIPCSMYALRPHFEGKLLRIPTSIPDDEMLFDRLRFNIEEVGQVWSKIMQRVYDLEGLFTLNIHPERGILCRKALDLLLDYATSRPNPVWITQLSKIAQWWLERSKFRLNIQEIEPGRWQVEALCTPRATILARHLTVEGQANESWYGPDFIVKSHSFIVDAPVCPCIGISPQTPPDVAEHLQVQGYPTIVCSEEEASKFALYLDMPEGWLKTRCDLLQQRSTLIQRIADLETPFLRFGTWPDAQHAALAITGDIDSITVQDFFLRIIEVN